MYGVHYPPDGWTRPIAFTHDGVEYRAFPESGCFFGVTHWNGRRYLLVVAMQTDGTPDLYDGAPNAGEVSNMHEPGDDTLLDSINAVFGTSWKQSDFFGR